MSIRISLPSIPRHPNSRAHPFPFQIAYQTQEFIQGTLFYASMADIAAGKYFRLPDGLKDVKQEMVNTGLQLDEWERDWKILGQYQSVFEKWVFQGVLILMRSHWDWYVRKLGGFVKFAREHFSCTTITKDEEKLLQQVGLKGITQQFGILEKACDLKFALSSDVLISLKEMALVRNLGLHNRWEVDSLYKKQTPSTNWDIGELRVINKAELKGWHDNLIKGINGTSVPIAAKFSQVPDYP